MDDGCPSCGIAVICDCMANEVPEGGGMTRSELESVFTGRGSWVGGNAVAGGDALDGGGAVDGGDAVVGGAGRGAVAVGGGFPTRRAGADLVP